MRTHMIFISLIGLFLLIQGVYGAFCCKDRASGESKCYSTGYCCNEYWYETPCFSFNTWVEGPSMFRVGQQTPVSLYVENTGAYTDSYDVTYEVQSATPNLIIVDMRGATTISDVFPDEIDVAYPRITVLSSTASGYVVFRVTSQGNTSVQKTATLRIVESDSYLSLPELGTFSTFLMITLAVFLFIFRRFDQGWFIQGQSNNKEKE